MTSLSITPWYLDKALIVTMLSFVLPPLSAKLGVPLSSDKVAAIIIVAATYILAHKGKSAFILWTEIKLKALAAVSDAPPPAQP